MKKKLDIELAVIERAEALFRKYGYAPDQRITMFLDLENANKQYPLDLEAMLAADNSNFAHDWFGIRRHMNRKTGLLEDCFVPRFAK
jgi:hypothetical protein